MALIFLMLATVADIVHTNNECKTTKCDCQVHNVEILKRLIDTGIGAALANIPGSYIILLSGYLSLYDFMLLLLVFRDSD